MTIRTFFCHTEGCPDYGRAREIKGNGRCGWDCLYCGAERKLNAPDEEESPAIDINSNLKGAAT